LVGRALLLVDSEMLVPVPKMSVNESHDEIDDDEIEPVAEAEPKMGGGVDVEEGAFWQTVGAADARPPVFVA